MKHILFILLIVITGLVNGFTQSYFSNLPGSFGLYQYNSGTRGMAMGGVTLALPDSIAPTAYGITQWGAIRHSRILMGGQYFITRTEIENFAYNKASAGINNVVIVIPLISGKWHLGFTLMPLSTNLAAFNRQYTASAGTYREISSRQANLGKAQFSMAWSPVPQVSMAVAYNYYFGKNIVEYKILFDSGDFNDIRLKDEYRLSGNGIGLYLGMNSIPRIRLTGFVEVSPRVNTIWRSSYSYAGKLTVSEEKNIQATIPTQVGAGISFKLGDHLTLATDGIYQNWSNGFGLLLPSLNIGKEWFHIGAGIELGALRERHTPLLRKIDWRLGVSVENTGYVFQGMEIYQYALHWGVGIPFFFGYNRLDFAIQAGTRGNKQLTIAKENFIKFNFGVSLGEKWFQRIR